MDSDLKITAVYAVNTSTKLELPLVNSSVQAGFPSPADDFIDKPLDLNEFLIRHPVATFFVRVSGTSMVNAGINSGDILIVDKSLEPSDGSIVVAIVENEFTVKRYRKQGLKVILEGANPNFKPIVITDGMEVQVWGVVTYVIHQCK